MSGSLDQISAGGVGWDQFATNERMFGVKSSYREELYTTKLDRSHPEFEKKLRHADTIAREIEGKVSSNPHIQEERNQKVDDSGIDEEDKYAGVIRGKQMPNPPPAVPVMGYAAAAAGNKYTPPAKRPETAKSAHHSDPAIISSKLQTPQTLVEPEKQGMTIEKSNEKPAPPSMNGTTIITPSATPEVEPTPTPTPPPPPPPITVQEPPQIQEVGQKFVKEEKVKIKRARNLIGTKEKQRQFAEFAQFSSSLTLNMPVPSDLLPILAGKDANKQKAILERNQELKRRQEEKQKSAPTSPAVGPAVVSGGSVSPAVSPGPSLAERLKANQAKGPGLVSPAASPTPLERPVQAAVTTTTITTTAAAATKKLDPSAKEFVFKVSAKEFKPSFATPSTHSPSPSRSSVVSPTPAMRVPSGPRVEEKARRGFKDRKIRKEGNGAGRNGVDGYPPRSDEKKMLAAYTTSPAWPLAESDDSNAKGYLDSMTEGKSVPPTPTSGHDDTSQSGHNYSRSSSVHPHHSTPHPPQLPTQPPNVVQYPAGLNPAAMYSPMGAQVPLNQYGHYVLSQPQQIPGHPQGVPQPGFASAIHPNQFQQHQQAAPYPRFQQQAYGSVSPSPMLQHAIPAPYAPQQAFGNGPFPQGYPVAPIYPGVVGPYGYVPQPQQQQNGGFSGHPSPGRAATQAQMVYPGMQGPPINMVQPLYQGSPHPLPNTFFFRLLTYGRYKYDAAPTTVFSRFATNVITNPPSTTSYPTRASTRWIPTFSLTE